MLVPASFSICGAMIGLSTWLPTTAGTTINAMRNPCDLVNIPKRPPIAPPMPPAVAAAMIWMRSSPNIVIPPIPKHYLKAAPLGIAKAYAWRIDRASRNAMPQATAQLQAAPTAPITIRVETEHYLVRSLDVADATERAGAWLADPAKAIMINAVPRAMSLAELKEYIASHDRIRGHLL